MAEPAKKVEDGLPRVAHLQVKHAVNIGHRTETTLSTERDGARPAIGPVPVLDMVLDKQLGGVVVRTRGRDGTGLHVIPLANVAIMRMVE